MKQLVRLLIVLTTTIGWSQKLPKIKGSGNVETKEVAMSEAFNRIEVDGDIAVQLSQGKGYGYAIETDDNLLEVVTFTVKDSALIIGVTHKIVKKKELNITLTAESISEIHLENNAQATATKKLSGKNLWIEAGKSTKFKFDLDYTDMLKVEMYSNAEGTLSSKSSSNAIKLEDRASLNLFTVSDSLDIEAIDNAKLSLDGTIEVAKLSSKGSSKIDANKASIAGADIYISDNADIFVNVKESVSLYLQDAAVLELYGDPEITVTGLKNKAKILKKE